jgi:hypothetical protein
MGISDNLRKYLRRRVSGRAVLRSLGQLFKRDAYLLEVDANEQVLLHLDHEKVRPRLTTAMHNDVRKDVVFCCPCAERRTPKYLPPMQLGRGPTAVWTRSAGIRPGLRVFRLCRSVARKFRHLLSVAIRIFRTPDGHCALQ